MATPRIVASVLLRASRTSAYVSSRQSRAAPVISRRLSPISKPLPSRFYSQESNNASKIYNFSEVKAFSESPSPSRILIDTREPHELLETGTIPSSINVPVSSKPDSFFISEEDFQDRFGFERPHKDTEVVFYCRAGVRSRAAAGLAREAGWTNVSEYSGSWLDWEKNGGEIEKGRKKGGSHS